MSPTAIGTPFWKNKKIVCCLKVALEYPLIIAQIVLVVRWTATFMIVDWQAFVR